MNLRITKPIRIETEARLAIDGGERVRSAPMPVRHLFGKAEKQAVVDLFDRAIADGSDLMGYGGEQEKAYCDAFAQVMGGGYADGVNSGTSAVYIALAALDLDPGDEVIVPPISDPGGVMPVAMLGCVPVAADATPGSFNTSAQEIRKVITGRTRAILVAHIAGLPVDMDPILQLARERNLRVVEDCAQTHGALYQGRPVGALGDIAAFSTMFGKHHASGGQGGIVFTRSEKLYWSARRRADRGKPMGIQGSNGNVVASLNFNMDELHAAIGRVSLARLPGFLAIRRRIARRIVEGCRGIEGVSIPSERPGDQASPWFILVTLDLSRLKATRDQFAQAVTAEGIPCHAGYPVFPMAMDWATLHWPAPPLPHARAVEACHCRILIHEGWTDEDADDVIMALAKVARAYAR